MGTWEEQRGHKDLKEIDKREYIINLIIELMLPIKEVLTFFYFKEVKGNNNMCQLIKNFKISLIEEDK